MKVVTPVLLFLFVVLLSCNRSTTDNGPESIFLDLEKNEEVDLGLDLVSVIPIETNENCLISWIGDFTYYKNRFFFLNSNRFKGPGVLAFNEQGDFLKKTKVGKGPGEMIEPFAFCIMDQKDQVFVHDQAQGPSFIYDLDLNFVEKVKHEYRFISAVEHLKDSSYLVNHHVPTSRERSDDQKYQSYTLYRDNFSSEHHLDVFVGREQSLNLTHPISVWKDNVLFVVPYSLQVYNLKDTVVNVKYKIELGTSVLNEEDLNKISDNEYRKLFVNKKLALLGGVYETDKWLGFKVYFDSKAMFYLRSKRDAKVYSLNHIADVPEEFNIKTLTEDGHVIGYMTAEEFIDYQKKSGLKKDLKVAETDNPIVLIFKIEK